MKVKWPHEYLPTAWGLISYLVKFSICERLSPKSVTTVIAKDVKKITVLETPDTFEAGEISKNQSEAPDEESKNENNEKLDEKIRIEKSEESEENLESHVETPASEAKSESEAGNEPTSYSLGEFPNGLE